MKRRAVRLKQRPVLNAPLDTQITPADVALGAMSVWVVQEDLQRDLAVELRVGGLPDLSPPSK